MDVDNESVSEKPAVDELCRLCANTDQQLIPIFQGEGVEHNIPEQIEKYLPIIKVTELDKLPLKICYQCTSTLIAWHNFFEQCRLADSRLRELLSFDIKFDHDDELYHDGTDDFHDDYEDQSNVGDTAQVEASVGLPVVDDTQSMETSENDLVNVDEKVGELETDDSSVSRCCLRSTYTSIGQEDPCANMLGTRCGRLLSPSCFSNPKNRRWRGPAVPTDPTGNEDQENRCPYSVCVCVWSIGDDCFKCLPYNKFACGFCPMIFLQTQLRNRHLRKTHPNNLLDHCLNWLYENSLKSCVLEASVGRRRKTERTSPESDQELPQFKCAECGQTLLDKRILIKHLRGHQMVRDSARRKPVVLRCEHCAISVTTKLALVAHLRSVHGEIFGDGNVQKLPSVATNAADVKISFLRASLSENNRCGTDYYTCDLCGHIFLKLHSFTRHLNVHSAKRYACSECKQSFASEQVLFNHKVRRHRDPPKNVFVLNGRKYLRCEQCPFTCRNERNKLDEHMRVHTGEKPFTCESCGKQFRTRSLLRVHRRFVHDGVKEHPCDLCGRSFSNRRYMEEHRRIHTGEKPLICDLCGKTFRQNSSLTKHVEYHMGIKRHACHMCGKRFSNSHQLRIHIKRHMGEATHVCAQCGKAFVDQYQLKNHYVVHSEARPFVCKECGAGFKLRKHLKQHERTHRCLP